MTMDARFQAIDVFVAKQINQSSKYFLLQLHESTLEAKIGCGGSQQQQRSLNLNCKLGLVKLTANENYLLFLASLIEYHFNDVQALINFFNQQLMPTSQPADYDQ